MSTQDRKTVEEARALLVDAVPDMFVERGLIGFRSTKWGDLQATVGSTGQVKVSFTGTFSPERAVTMIQQLTKFGNLGVLMFQGQIL